MLQTHSFEYVVRLRLRVRMQQTKCQNAVPIFVHDQELGTLAVDGHAVVEQHRVHSRLAVPHVVQLLADPRELDQRPIRTVPE